MTDGQNQRLGAYVETSAAGERVRAYVPAPTAAVIDSQSVKSAEKGGRRLTHMGMMRARR